MYPDASMTQEAVGVQCCNPQTAEQNHSQQRLESSTGVSGHSETDQGGLSQGLPSSPIYTHLLSHDKDSILHA